MQEYGLEPLQRARSNTWPLPRPDAEDGGPQLPDGGSPPQLLDNAVGGGGGPSSSSSSSGGGGGGLLPPQLHQQQQLQQHQQQVVGAMVAGPAKKTSSRRNAWGNQSYADLITQAISSVPEQRLTLSQIYEWMVQNVPYFKDKGDSNSSAGWKVRRSARVSRAIFPLSARTAVFTFIVIIIIIIRSETCSAARSRDVRTELRFGPAACRSLATT